MKFYSTNRNIPGIGFSHLVSFSEALSLGIAPDGGLFMPERIPLLSKADILVLKEKPYAEVAFEVLKNFLLDPLTEDQLKHICSDAYNFDIPIEKFNNNIFLARMDQGPTASFKDFAARLLSRLMSALKTPGKTITVLVATSGDTGGAVGEAFKGLKETRVIILYPKKEVSTVQKKQLDGIGENVISIQVEGNFDDCQLLVKSAFADEDLKKHNLTSANSINVGRVLPQIVYYFYLYLKAAKDFEKIIFTVPTGNLGNALGCEIARRMGLPVEKIILATNANNEVPEFLKNASYKKISPSINSISNAMNVGNPSNLARFFDLYGGTVDKEGLVHKMPDIDAMRKNLFSESVSDAETVTTIKEAYEKNNVLLEPHGAVGVAVTKRYFSSHPALNCIVLETAHPAKFPEVIEKELKIQVPLPASMRSIKNNIAPVSLSNRYSDLKKFISSIQ